MATFDEFYESLPGDSNKRGEYFEKVFVPWFLKTDPEWSTQVKEIWLWDDYPHRWGKDCGIDLVYMDRQGNHWAVQSKCVSPEREISKAEIDSFLSESSDPRIHGRLLIASTDGIGKNAQQVIDRQEKQVVCFLLEHFRHSEVDFPSTPEDLSTGQRKEKRTPRPHQREAIRNVVKGFKTEDRGQLLMACGTGKTLTSLWIEEAVHAKRTLVLVPSLGLLSQTLREWTATSQQQFNWICVCSDKSVAKQDKTADNLIERVSGLGVPVTSDPKDIKDFLENENGGVVFSTYQSSELVAESQKNQSTPGFDITFADEAHRCTGKVSSAFACVLDDERIRSDKRLFMTATPRVLSKQIKKKADEENINLACMDDVSQFGEVFHQLNFSEAIDRELLSDYKVVIVGVDDPSVEAKIIDRSIVQTRGDLEIDTETLANHIALAKAIKDYDLSRMITFHSRVKSAKKFSDDHPLIIDWIPEGSKSPKSSMTSYVSGEMNAKTRNNEITKLRNISEQEVGILANSRCLSEGVDVPTLDGIAFFDPRSSQVDIIQAVGRAIRKSENKTDGYIILPVYLGDTTNVEDEILKSRFKDIWSIILALKSQDDSLRDELDQLRVELGRRREPTESVNGLFKIIFDLPSNISTTFADSLTTILVRETTENWMEKYGQLLDYFKEHGNTRVPHNDQCLGVWTMNQRSLKKRQKLSYERIKLLEKVKFSWSPFDERWEENFELLKEFISEKGNSLVPKRHPLLGTWVSEQRKNKSKGILSSERIQLLESIDFVWDPIEHEWQSNYQILKQYFADNGDTNIPSSSRGIGNWVATQRKNKSKGILSSERVQLLDNIQFKWDVLKDDWENNCQKLKQHIKECGCDVMPPQDPQLAKWISHQRDNYKNGKLSKERIETLNKIGLSWDPIDEKWNKMYTLLKQYIKENGNPLVPQDHQLLGNWVSNQRVRRLKGKISEERIQLLDQIDFIWDPHEQVWQNNYGLLKQYFMSNGHTNVPSKYPKLGEWVLTQRKAMSKGTLSKERIQLLESIQFSWNPRDDEWHKNYQLYKEYLTKKGDSNTPIRFSKIRQWTNNQRSKWRRGKLSEERIRLLDEIGFVWDPSNN